MPQFIYTMKGLGKVHPPDTRVLEDIWLSFLPGAKIGVLGLNGAGKSSILKIMSGEDQQFLGEAFPAAGISIGMLHQEPRLDPTKTVLGNVEEGVAETRALLTRYDEVNAKLGEDLSPDEMEKVLDEQSRIQDKIDASNAWDLDSRLDLAMDALRLPAGRGRGGDAVRGRAPPRRALPPAPAVARSAAARRADEPPRCGVRRVARAVSQGLFRHGRRRHARSLFPRQRRGLDSGARSRSRHPVGRQLFVLAGAETESPAAGGEGGDAKAANARARAGVDSHVAQGAPGEGQGAPQRLRGAAARGDDAEDRDAPRSTSRQVRGSGTWSSRRGSSARGTARTC